MTDMQTKQPDTKESAPAFLTLTYNEVVFERLEEVVEGGRLLDGVLVDAIQTGFSMQVDLLAKFVIAGQKLLKPRGVLLFIKSDGAIALTRDDPAGGLVINVFDSPYGILARYPALARHAVETISGIDERRINDGGGTLVNHILLSSVPVLTEAGRTAKDEVKLQAEKNWIVQMIDDYTTIESIIHRLEQVHQQTSQESLAVLQEMEQEGLIFPIFPRIQFLANCYQNQKPFRLGRYMVASGIISDLQLQELLEQQQEEGADSSKRLLLGMLAVRAGYITTRQLQVMLADQYLYGGYHRWSDDTSSSTGGLMAANTFRDSMLGSLGAIDPPGLLQSLSTASKTGLLTIENQDRILLVCFDDGSPTHARMNELIGFDALVEFITSWTEGIFVFRDRGISTELSDACRLNATLDRVLLDSALFHDNINQILAALPEGKGTILERVGEFEKLWFDLASEQLAFMDESLVSDDDRRHIAELAAMIDGLSTVEELAGQFSWPRHKIMKAIQLLLERELVSPQQGSIFGPLSVFQMIVRRVKELIGPQTNKVILHSSLHYAHGESPATTRFQIDQEGNVSVNLKEMKQSQVLASSVLPELRQWMEAYIAYCRQKVEPQLVEEIVQQAIKESSETD